MKKYLISISNMFKLMKKDFSIYALCFLPIIIIIVYNIATDYLYDFFREKSYNIYIIAEPLIIISLISILPLFIGFYSAFNIIDEMDNRIQKYFFITPFGKKGYIISRIIIPSILVFLLNIIILAFTLNNNRSFFNMASLAIASSMAGVIICLVIVDFANNKVEAMAVGKISGLFLANMYIPFVDKWREIVVFYVFPTYWYGDFMRNNTYLSFAICLGLSIIWITLLLRKMLVKANNS